MNNIPEQIVLIYPKHDTGIKRYLTDKSIDKHYQQRPQCGLEYIAAVIEDSFGKHIKIYDGEIISEEEIIENIPKNGIVGLSDWSSNHSNVIKLAKIAKEAGNKVIIGGVNILSDMPAILLKKYPFIDYIVFGDGEMAFKKIVERIVPEKIENLWYRKNGKIVSNENKNVDIIKLPLFNLEHSVGREKYYFKKEMWWTPVAGIRGCINAVKCGKRCTFCTRAMTGIRVLPPKRYWEQIQFLNKNYGITKFFETGEVFSVGNYPEKLAEAKPKNFGIKLRVYEGITSIDKKIYHKVAKKIGISEIFLGIEHVSSNIIKLHKNVQFNKKRIEETLQTLKDLDIKFSFGMVFGLPGETLKSAEENYNFCKYLVDNYDNISGIFVNIATPFRGNKLFKFIINNPRALADYKERTGKDLINDDLPDYDVLIDLNIKYNCGLTAKDVYYFTEKARGLL